VTENYWCQVRAGECERIAKHIGTLLAELPETGTPDAMPSDVVTGMAIAYKLVRGLLHARAERLNTGTDRRYPR